MTSDIFSSSRAVQESRRKELKSQGLGNRPNRSEMISDSMIELLWEKNELGKVSPRALQNAIFVAFTNGFGFRGCHESRQLALGGVELKCDEKGQEFLMFAERLTQTRTGATGSNARSFQPKLFATGGARCRIELYKLYCSHRPNSMCKPESPFYLGVKNKRHPNDKTWYINSPMGKDNAYDGQICEDRI